MLRNKDYFFGLIRFIHIINLFGKKLNLNKFDYK